jgi:hypothetical protein
MPGQKRDLARDDAKLGSSRTALLRSLPSGIPADCVPGQSFKDLFHGSPEVNLDLLACRVLKNQNRFGLASIYDWLGSPHDFGQLTRSNVALARKSGAKNRARQGSCFILHPGIIPGYKPMSILSG